MSHQATVVIVVLCHIKLLWLLWCYVTSSYCGYCGVMSHQATVVIVVLCHTKLGYSHVLFTFKILIYLGQHDGVSLSSV